jgi:hypothetical protein
VGVTSQGATGIEMAGADVFESVAPGDAAPAPGSSGAMSPGLHGPYLSGSPGSSSPPINWRRVENEAESACSQVATMEWLLHETLASVHRNILHLVQVSSEKGGKISAHIPMTSCLLIFPVFCARSFYPRAAQMFLHCW